MPLSFSLLNGHCASAISSIVLRASWRFITWETLFQSTLQLETSDFEGPHKKRFLFFVPFLGILKMTILDVQFHFERRSIRRCRCIVEKSVRTERCRLSTFSWFVRRSIDLFRKSIFWSKNSIKFSQWLMMFALFLRFWLYFSNFRFLLVSQFWSAWCFN